MTDKSQTVVFFVRHGRTDRVYSDDKTVDGERVLTQQGIAQMEKVGEYLKSFAPSAIYSSPLRRTTQCAAIIKEKAGIGSEVEERPELVEVYSSSDYRSVATRMPKFFEDIIAKNPGQQLVCVSHQDVIQATLDSYDLTEEEKAFPCQMGEMYRLVFADTTLVECQKLKPADN